MPSTGAETHILWTYDPAGRVYRLAFLSGASLSLINGRWDAKTDTMKWSSVDLDGNTGTGEHRFIDEDHAVWSQVVKSPDGTVVFDASAKQTRLKNGATAEPRH